MTANLRAFVRRTPIVLAAFLAVASAAPQLHGQVAREEPPSLTAVGCIAVSPDAVGAPPTGHEQAAAKGLQLTRATVRTPDARANAASAVPGSRPAGSGTGTTDSASPRAPARVAESFWLVGAKSAELLRFLGRRVEITGPLDDRLAANPGGQTVTDAGAAAPRKAATAPVDPAANAHPSAPTRAISVTTFRVIDESCS